MKPLRAFLFVRDAEGHCDVSVFRDLEPLIEAAAMAVEKPATAAAIHVGFWRPDTAEVGGILTSHPGRALVSDSMRAALPLPPVVATSAGPVALASGIAFHLALEGIGYSVADPTCAHRNDAYGPPADAGADADADAGADGWVATLRARDPSLASATIRAGILDEASYQAHESRLEADLRWRLGLARMSELSGHRIGLGTILDALWAAPPWLMAFPLSFLDLRTRQVNGFRSRGYSTVSDISTLGLEAMLKVQNFGRGSVEHVAKEVYAALMNGFGLSGAQRSRAIGNAPLATGSESEATESGEGMAPRTTHRFEAEFSALEPLLGEKQFDVWASRFGYRREASTLQEIADRVGVTRERIRQIEKRAQQKLQTHPLWAELAVRLDKVLDGRDSALLIDGLAAVDPWFENALSLAPVLDHVFQNFMGDRFGAFKVSGAWTVSQITKDEWHEACRGARSALMTRSDAAPLEEDFARSICESMLVGKGEELRGELWTEATEGAVWSSRDDVGRQLLGFGKGADGVVRAVLETSDTPLHYAEIHRRASTMVSPPHDLRTILNSAHGVALLYGRGTYGLLFHCGLTAEQMDMLRAEMEDVMEGADASRQWHAMELRDEMAARGLGFEGKLTKYVASFILRQSEQVEDLGRLIWKLKADDGKATERLDVRQAVLQLLEREGRPMSTASIRAKLIEGRGLNTHFQLHPSGELIRVGPGMWGLASRDLDQEPTREALLRLRAVLASRQTGLHATEVAAVLNAGDGRPSPSFHAAMSLAEEFGIRVDRGQHAYLAVWGGSRRISVLDAVRSTLAESRPTGVEFDRLCARVDELTMREVQRMQVSQTLQAVDAEHDPETGLWLPANAQEAEPTGEPV